MRYKIVFSVLLIFACMQGNAEVIPAIQGKKKIETKGSQGNFVGPTIQGRIGKDFCYGAVAALLEAGFRQYRANGTLGFAITPNDGLKASLDYLTQNLKYRFISGDEREWIHQLATGLAYQHSFSMRYLKTVEVDGYYSHSWSRNLSRRTVFDIFGEPVVDCRRIAGADAWGGNAGLSFLTFTTTTLGLKGNYDHVRYRTDFSGGYTKSGFGGTATLSQKLAQGTYLHLLASFRKPFNYYSGKVDWSPANLTNLVLGVFADHTSGKFRLPSSSDVGVHVSYIFGPKSGKSNNTQRPKEKCQTRVSGWLTEPAVFMPQVLAIADEKLQEVRGQSCRLLSTTTNGDDESILNIPVDCCISPTYEVIPFDMIGDQVLIQGFAQANGTGTMLFSEAFIPQGPTIFAIPGGVDLCSIRSITVQNDAPEFQTNFTFVIECCEQ